MSSESARSTVRSVDSVANIYSIVIGLALTEAIETLIGKTGAGAPAFDVREILQGLPAFISLLVTLVPFWHGMNRHLDRCYITKTTSVKHQAILFDFFVFFIEATLLFMAGWFLKTGLVTFYCLGLLLVVDMLWGFLSHTIHFRGHKSHVTTWSGINLGFGLVGVLVCAFPFNAKLWVLMCVAIGRTVVDYWKCSDFYFPQSRGIARSPES